MSTTALTPFRNELKKIRETAAELPSLSPTERRKRIAAVLRFVEGPLARHA